MPAKRLIYIFLTKDDKLVAGRESVGMVRRASTFYANRMNFLNIFSNSHQCRHRAKGLSHEIGIKPGDDNPHSPVSKSLDNFNDRIIEELRLIDAYDFDIA